MKKLLLAATFVLSSLLIGCESQPKAAAAGTTSMCCMSGEPCPADGPMSDFKGQKVQFCCEKCQAKFDAMDDAGKQAKLDAAKMKK